MYKRQDVTGACEKLYDDKGNDVEMVNPGDTVTMDVSLIVPIAMEKGLLFAIREGGRTVGSGQVLEIIE